MAAPVRFATLFPIGRGGMGAVEVAVDSGQGRGDPKGPRIVALKRLLSDVAKDKRHVEAFLREARVALLLTHPNVVGAHWVGEQDGQAMIAMDYVEGESLADVLKKGPLPPKLAAFVMAEVCAGLHAAHELKDVGGKSLALVHRDVSPHNVMIGYDGRVLVLDFGVAKIDSGANNFTRTGEVKGKAAYMSPEQGLGDPLDRRSDLYAVGAVLYECIAGKRMWSGETEMAVLKQLALEEPPKLDGDLGPIVSALVARDPEKRPKSGADVEAMLREHAGTQEDLAARMRELFADSKKEKHERLEAALHDREDAEALRASLMPESAPTRTGRKEPDRSWLPWAVLAGAVAIPAIFFFGRTSPPKETPQTATATATTTTTTPSTSTSGPAPAASSITAEPSTTIAPSRTAAIPAIRTSAPIPKASASAVPSGSASSKTPDVDPHPF